MFELYYYIPLNEAMLPTILLLKFVYRHCNEMFYDAFHSRLHILILRAKTKS